MCSRRAVALVTSALLCLSVPAAQAQDRWRVDLENGAAIAGYNDVRIPGDTGTMFSLTDDLVSDTAYFRRLRADVRIAPKHVLSALVAPLTINSAGTFDSPVSFAGATSAPGVPTTGLYVFNSYRVTYRYEPVRRENWMFGIGVTLKVRDAETRLEAGGTSAAKTNVGIVPLVWSFDSEAPGAHYSGRRAPCTSGAARSADSMASNSSRTPARRTASAPVRASAATCSSRFAASRLLITIAMNRLMTTKTASTTKLT